MGRRFPVGENHPIHPLLSLSLLIACIAATMAIVSSLCGEKKKPNDPSANDQNKIETSEVLNPPNDHSTRLSDAGATPPPAATGEADNTTTTSTASPGGDADKPLPPPPGSHSRAASYHVRSSSTASQGKLLSTMSMKVQGGGKDHHHDKKKEKKLKHEDSIWQKTIILGEKCKVPDEDDNDTILYDDKGNRISSYHKKASASVALSRQTSSIDPEAIPNKE